MPSWPRLIAGSSTAHRHGSATAGDRPEGRGARHAPRTVDADAPSHSAPVVNTLRATPDATASRTSSPYRPKSGHARSLSNPFPTLFGTGKRSDKGAAAKDAVEVETTDDETEWDGVGADVGARRTGNARDGGTADKDTKTGRCMTCDSTVRWSKGAASFRCSVCSTINDLTPRGHGPARAGQLGDASNGAHPGVTPRPALLSLERTQSIIDRCVTRYLDARLKTGHGVQMPTQERAGGTQDADMATGARGAPRVPMRPEQQRQGAPLPSPRLGPPSPRFGSSGGSPAGTPWDIPQPRTSPGITVYSTSSPGYFPSPGEQFVPRMDTPFPAPPTREPPPPPVPAPPRTPSEEMEQMRPRLDRSPRPAPIGIHAARPEPQRSPQGFHSIFRPLEEYIVTCFGSWESINASFQVGRPTLPARSASEDMGKIRRGAGAGVPVHRALMDQGLPLSHLDAKTLLLGDFAENGSWWTGHRADGRSPSLPLQGDEHAPRSHGQEWGIVSYKTPRIDWAKLDSWYRMVLTAGHTWKMKWEELSTTRKGQASPGPPPHDLTDRLREIEEEMEQSRLRVQRTLLQATENLLKRPGRPLRTPQDVRFLLILLANPLLYPPSNASRHSRQTTRGSRWNSQAAHDRISPDASPPNASRFPSATRPHPGIVKRILGLLANLPNECHHILISWFSRLSDPRFRRMVDLVGTFVTYRLGRQHARQRSDPVDPIDGLIPEFVGPGLPSSARLHAALGVVTSTETADDKLKSSSYSGDWQIKAAAKVMALLFAANSNSGSGSSTRPASPGDGAASRAGSSADKTTPGQTLPINEFYNSRLEFTDLIADFEMWESRRGGFSFCQYPFFLSIGAKTQILQYDARRQMGRKAREAFFDSILRRTIVEQHLVLRVRRDCLVEDSLRAVSEVVGAGQEEIKKELRIDFVGEEGVDAGGLRKEWFLLLVRDVFDPNYGLFTYDDDSHYCYFNPHCFETSDQFFLVGVLLGLAIYNSTILDIALPPFAFKRLLAVAPSSSSPGLPNTSIARAGSSLTLDDLAEYRPALAHGLRQLLQYDNDDIEEVFCLDFAIDTERYGQVVRVPLCADGENKPVTKANRREYVDLYVHYVLDTAVSRQFEPFKRGFYTVCGGGHALSLFRPEEIELLVRGSGSDEPLDISSLRGVAVYEQWPSADPSQNEPVIQWFWDFLARLPPRDQRKVLGFVTGTDRVPALGTSHLVMRLVCVGEDCDRFPLARTCFNALCLWRYASEQKLCKMLWRAVVDSEGFGLK